MSYLDVEIEGRVLQLMAERGVYVPAAETLLVADTHFGKEATFRNHQIPVPSGSTAATLGVISTMLRTTRAKRLVFLGDLFHATCSRSADVMQSLDEFFAAFQQVEISLTLGNHDRRLGKLPVNWSLNVTRQMELGDIQLAHEPQSLDAGVCLLCCGHLHPAVRVDRGSDRTGKLPCFWLTERQLILPAIGNFTGTQLVHPRKSDRVWVCAEGQVVAVV